MDKKADTDRGYETAWWFERKSDADSWVVEMIHQDGVKEASSTKSSFGGYEVVAKFRAGIDGDTAEGISSFVLAKIEGAAK